MGSSRDEVLLIHSMLRMATMMNYRKRGANRFNYAPAGSLDECPLLMFMILGGREVGRCRSGSYYGPSALFPPSLVRVRKSY